MIISASRRTDIPSYYSEWFLNRIREGYVFVRNPMNFHQISKVRLDRDVVDGIVFWTKNPIPMIKHLDTIKTYGYDFYFQFTVTPYGRDVEPNIPVKSDAIMSAFIELSERIGKDRVIWRYDPILLNEKYTQSYHIRAFEKMASRLHNYTNKCTISFIDFYRNTANNIRALQIEELDETKICSIAKPLSEIAYSYGLKMDTCAETADLSEYGIEHARCIDDQLFEHLLGCKLRIGKDKNQRLECGCVASVDIGAYNTCKTGCRYCYANFSEKTVRTNAGKHNPKSSLLFGEIGADDIVNEREMKSCIDPQILIDSFLKSMD